MHKIPSRFIRKTLLPDERMVLDARFHPIYTLIAFFGMLSFVALGVAVQYAMWKYMRYWTLWPAAIGAFVGAWQFFWMMMKKWTTEIVLTDQRLIYKHGFFMIEAAEVDIEQLASDNVVQSFIGRLFDYGVLHIRCIEASDIWLPPIAKPYEFRNAIEHQKHQYRERYMSVERLRHHGTQPGDVK